MSQKKILIIHDRFQFRGGAERLILLLARELEADIATEFWEDGQTFPRKQVLNKLYVLDKGEPGQIIWRYFRAHINFYFKTKKFIRNYDLVIFSGNNCLTASFNLSKKVPKILYCHSPVRYVYDLLPLRRKAESSLLKRIIYYDIGKWGIRAVYRLGLKKMNKVIANSRNVQNRLKRFCRTDSEIIYPPIEVDKFKWLGQEDYYLSFARLDELKRVGDIVKAFQKMPDKKLVVCSGGSELEKIKQMASGFSNIEVRGWVEDEELKNLIGNCIASIYIPIDEDFGMTPVESMSAGKPCIVVDEGGMKETIIDGKTGKVIPADYEIEDIMKAVKELTPENALLMKKDCIACAQQFSKEKFIRKIRFVIENMLQVKVK